MGTFTRLKLLITMLVVCPRACNRSIAFSICYVSEDAKDVHKDLKCSPVFASSTLSHRRKYGTKAPINTERATIRAKVL
jgi:hypothetical protein